MGRRRRKEGRDEEGRGRREVEMGEGGGEKRRREEDGREGWRMAEEERVNFTLVTPLTEYAPPISESNAT